MKHTSLLPLMAVLARDALCPARRTRYGRRPRFLRAQGSSRVRRSVRQVSQRRQEARRAEPGHTSRPLKGGDTGPGLLPGSPTKACSSRRSATPDDDMQMPPKGKLPDSDIADLTDLGQAGAAWPASRPRASRHPPAGSAVYRPGPRLLVVPPGAQSASRRQGYGLAEWPLDRFILARLEARALRPVHADGRTLIRRATFDLIGLPPTPEEVEALRQAIARRTPSPTVVDRLLASPHYGERWGRHWLDVARYGEDQAHTFRRQALSATPSATATGSSRRSTTTCLTTASSSSRSPAT